MADVLDFMKKIDYNNFVEGVTKYFDEAMAMYNVIGYLDISHIHFYDEELPTTEIRYIVEPTDIQGIEHLVSALSNSTITVYGNVYNIHIMINANTLDITLIRIKSL